ncbi:hypothetical protein GQ600_3878 [Phytophthora cactorum]|nr:hypothetical protein GQ600_3878 [Phytophthora cactorum]
MKSRKRDSRCDAIAWLKRLKETHKSDVTFSTKKSLTVHLLGADHREGNTGAETYEVFRSFRGTNLHLTRLSQEFSETDAKTCQVDISYFVGGFESYFEDKTLYCEPDLVVCFNAGIWGYDEWLPAIRLLLNEVRVPLLVTSYNKHEAGDDEDVLDELQPFTWLWRPEKNPHGARTPRATNNEDGSILKENDYWLCLSGRP